MIIFFQSYLLIKKGWLTLIGRTTDSSQGILSLVCWAAAHGKILVVKTAGGQAFRVLTGNTELILALPGSKLNPTGTIV